MLTDLRTGELNVMDIQEISWREDAFQRLVLPQNEKDVLLAFISRPDQDEDFIDDVIPEKGCFPSNRL
jgi:hypothetical protein